MSEENPKELSSGHVRDEKNKDIKSQDSFDYYMSFIFKKTEKLTVAVYMITDFFNSQEPLKWELRDRSVALLSFMGSFASQGGSHKGVPFKKSVQLISEILSFLELACSLNFISQMNYAVIREEYVALRDIIIAKENANDPVADFTFPKGFFSEMDVAESRSDSPAQIEARGQSEVAQTEVEPTPPRVQIRNPDPAPQLIERDSMLPKKELKNMRRDSILKFLRTRPNATIKDIVSVISNCSEKTIQRELILLIQQGVVTRAGERRWSTYSLV